MKHLKLSILGAVFILSLCQCEKEEYLQFGEPDYDIVTDSIYFCETDGFLKVDLIERATPFITGSPSGWIYSDETSPPETRVAIIYTSTTIPINKGKYWIISESNLDNEYLISWTPLINKE